MYSAIALTSKLSWLFLRSIFSVEGRYVFRGGVGGRVAGASERRVISESEHQKGRVIALCKLFKGIEGNTPSPDFFMRIFVALLSISSYRFSVHL